MGGGYGVLKIEHSSKVIIEVILDKAFSRNLKLLASKIVLKLK